MVNIDSRAQVEPRKLIADPVIFKKEEWLLRPRSLRVADLRAPQPGTDPEAAGS